MEPPYKLVLAKISSPARTTFNSAFVIAAIPDAQATDAIPPSNAVISFSKAKIVGLLILV